MSLINKLHELAPKIAEIGFDIVTVAVFGFIIAIATLAILVTLGSIVQKAIEYVKGEK